MIISVCVLLLTSSYWRVPSYPLVDAPRALLLNVELCNILTWMQVILCIKIAFIAEVPTAECWGCVILEIQYARNMKVLTERNPIWPCLVQKWASLQKTGFYALNSEWKKVPAGSHSSLAHAFLLLAALWCHLVHFQGKKSILPYFSSLSIVAISVSFPEVRNRKETESGLV